MIRDILLQVCFFLVSAFMYLWMHEIPQRAFSKLRAYRNRSIIQYKQHFVRGAQLLSEAQAASTAEGPAAAASLAAAAADEADKSISLLPDDAAAHILKALALDLQGFRTSALASLDVALSPLAAKSLSDEERGDALLKRAKMKATMGTTQPEQVDSAIADLIESLKLKSNNARAYCILGGCYEEKGQREEAKKAYEEAARLEPKSVVAREGLDRLAS